MKTAAAMLMMCVPMTAAMAQDAPRPAAASAFEAKTVVEAVRSAIRDNYVVAERKAAIDAALARGLAAGRYNGVAAGELVRRVNEDLAAAAQDKHLGLRHDPVFAADIVASGPEVDPTEGAHWREQARRRNEGVTELKVLPGNIRLMRYDGFFWNGDVSRAAIDAAMVFLRGGAAIIIDIRDNGGGSPDAVKRLTSYFVPAGAKLITFHMRQEAPTDMHAETVPGGRVDGVPVYVLTSGRTGSAAEEFSAHVADFGFATLIGETTAGAAYRNDFIAIPGGFVLSVSVGRPVLPKGGDWEGKGVPPQYAVASDLALDRALQDASTRLAAKAQGPDRTEREWAAARHAARVTAAKPTLPMGAYAGRYGERVVSVEGAGLAYQRGAGPRGSLLPLGGDLFAVEADPRARIRFVASDGLVTGLVIERSDGSRDEASRD